jgi:hypothetical protein
MYTANAGPIGVSGKVDVLTGTSVGTSGLIQIKTGLSGAGTGGGIDVIVGSGVSGNGGAVYMSAGLTTATNREGGDFEIKAGTGAAPDGGQGGEVLIYGGSGLGTTNGHGGEVKIFGGTGQTLSGGSVFVTSGIGIRKVQETLFLAQVTLVLLEYLVVSLFEQDRQLPETLGLTSFQQELQISVKEAQ